MRKAGVRKSVGQRPVVGQQDKSFAVQVKPANGKDAGRASRQQVGNSPAPAPVSADVAQKSPGFVDSEVDVAFRKPERLSINGNRYSLGVYFRAQGRDNISVDAHAPGSYQFFACSAAGYPSRRQYFLQPFFSHLSLGTKSVMLSSEEGNVTLRCHFTQHKGAGSLSMCRLTAIPGPRLAFLWSTFLKAADEDA